MSELASWRMLALLKDDERMLSYDEICGAAPDLARLTLALVLPGKDVGEMRVRSGCEGVSDFARETGSELSSREADFCRGCRRCVVCGGRFRRLRLAALVARTALALLLLCAIFRCAHQAEPVVC